MAAQTADRLESDRILLWHDKDLAERGVSLYEMVGASDLLVTDASSVYVDWLVLDKPVVVAFPDLEDYRRTRGFALEPVEDYFAGPVATDFAGLTDGLARSLDGDAFAARRAQVAALFHDQRDDGAARRVIGAVMTPAAPPLAESLGRPGIAEPTDVKP